MTACELEPYLRLSMVACPIASFSLSEKISLQSACYRLATD